MRKAFEIALAAMNMICRVGTVAAFAVLILVVSMQVAGRIPGVGTPAWTEEIARFALLHLVAFSCGLALLDGEMVGVDLVTSQLPERAQAAISKLVDVAVMVFGLAMIPSSWLYLSLSVDERARSFEGSMLWSYVIVLIIPVSLTFYALARLFGYGRTPPLEELV
jgi:TRAP-type C4-dicarboxylate transport system permease small subunit